MNKTYPTLYTKNATGKIVVWSIWVECEKPKGTLDKFVIGGKTAPSKGPATIYTKYGQENGN